MEPLKRQQRKVDNEYTIMFIPHRGKEPKSFSFRASLLKKIGIFCGILLLAGIGIAAKSSMVVYQAHQEQNELIAYRNDKAAQDQKLAELQKENEKMQKDMAELSALENEVRKALGSNVSQRPSRGGIDRSQYMGKGGPSAPADIKMIDVTAVQAKNLQTEMQQKKAVLGDLLAQLHERNAKLDATPDIWPTAGGEITSRFGGRANPFSGTGYDYHPGIDIGNDYGAPVYAGATGYVEYAGWYSGYGRYVKISHGYGYETAYGHMSSIEVSSGQYVEKGDVIGYVGSSGYSTGPHLHYEVIINGQDSDPLKLIR